MESGVVDWLLGELTREKNPLNLSFSRLIVALGELCSEKDESGVESLGGYPEKCYVQHAERLESVRALRIRLIYNKEI